MENPCAFVSMAAAAARAADTVVLNFVIGAACVTWTWVVWFSFCTLNTLVPIGKKGGRKVTKLLDTLS